MLMSMAYLDQILPVSSTAETVEVTGPGLPKTPTDVCSLFSRSCVCVPHAYFSCTRMYMFCFFFTKNNINIIKQSIQKKTTKNTSYALNKNKKNDRIKKKYRIHIKRENSVRSYYVHPRTYACVTLPTFTRDL